MKTQLWTKAEIANLLGRFATGQPAPEIASVLGRTEASVRYKLHNMGYSTRRVTEPRPTISGPSEACDDLRETQIDEESTRGKAQQDLLRTESRREIRALENDYKQDALEERILKEFREKLLDLPLRIEIPHMDKPVVRHNAQSDVAVIVLSDSHIGQVVDIRETESTCAYNPAVFIARLHHLETEVARILAAHPVQEIVILFAGDIVHGRLGHTFEDDLTQPIATQVDLALHAFYQFMARLSTMATRVTVHGVGGNHDRWPGLRKVPTERRWSGLDTLCYQSLHALTAKTLPNVTFDERISARRIVDIGDFRLLLMHGDQLRGPHCAANGIAREMQHWLMRSVQTGQRPPELVVIGDKHVSANLPVGLGRAIVNGSFVGEDVFSQNFAPSPPSQTVFFIRPGSGLTETHVIRLDQAQVYLPMPYDLKPTLARLVESFARKTLDL